MRHRELATEDCALCGVRAGERCRSLSVPGFEYEYFTHYTERAAPAPDVHCSCIEGEHTCAGRAGV